MQAYQVYALKWPMHDARGVLGQAFPYSHLFPSAPEAARMHCTCSLRLHSATI